MKKEVILQVAPTPSNSSWNKLFADSFESYNRDSSVDPLAIDIGAEEKAGSQYATDPVPATRAITD